jgi:hypothetical protein
MLSQTEIGYNTFHQHLEAVAEEQDSLMHLLLMLGQLVWKSMTWSIENRSLRPEYKNPKRPKLLADFSAVLA